MDGHREEKEQANIQCTYTCTLSAGEKGRGGQRYVSLKRQTPYEDMEWN